MNYEGLSSEQIQTLLKNPNARTMLTRVQNMISKSKSYDELMRDVQIFIDTAPKSPEGDLVRGVMLDWKNKCALEKSKGRYDDWSKVVLEAKNGLPKLNEPE